MKRILTVFLAFISLLTLFTAYSPKAHAAEPAKFWMDQPQGKFYDECDEGRLEGGCYVRKNIKSAMNAVATEIIPTIGFSTEKPEKLLDMQKNSLVGIMSRYIAFTFTTPPASTYAFLKDTARSLGFMPKTIYAQDRGIGFTGMEALLPLWRMFRNIAYFFLALVMVVIGFMIMFRKKIDPHTVVSVQNALPRILLTLGLITFSYAIVGVLIDLMYVLILFTVVIFESTGLLPSKFSILQYLFPNLQNQHIIYSKGSLLELFSTIEVGPWQILGVPPPVRFSANTPSPQSILSNINIFSTLSNLLNSAKTLITNGPPPEVLQQTIGAAIMGVAGTLLYFLFSLAFLFIFIRLLILFVSTYIQIIMSLLIGPVQILLGALPGNDSFSSWFKNLIANIAVYPVAGVMFMLSNVFANLANNATGTQLWIPPYTDVIRFNDPVANTTAIAALISLGLIFAIPSVCNQVKESLKAKAPIAAGPGAIIGPFGSSAGQAFQLFYQGSMISSFLRHEPKPSTPGERQLKAAGKGLEGFVGSATGQDNHR